MKQKQQVLAQLTQYFDEIDTSQCLQIRKIGSKKYLYTPGDPISHIYFVLKGEVKISFLEKEICLPPQIIVGDYELLYQLTRRTTSLKAKTKAQIVILPKQYLQKRKKQLQQQQKFLSLHLHLSNHRLTYILYKLFRHTSIFRGQEILCQKYQNSSDLILIKSGLFIVKKFIGVGIIQKYHIEVEKQFALVQIGEGELIRESICCDSPKGEVYVCKRVYLEEVRDKFQEVDGLLKDAKDMKDSLLDRQKSIKNLCISNQSLPSSILPPVFQSDRLKTKRKSQDLQPKLERILKTEPSERSNTCQFQVNHYQINRTNNNDLFSLPTNSNLSLIPMVRIRRPSLPQTVRIPRKKVLEKFFENKVGKINILPKKLVHNQEADLIPGSFSSRFEKKMFYRPSNPFHHFKQKSLVSDEKVQQQLQTSKQLQNSSPISPKLKQKKSFLLISNKSANK